MAKKKQRAAKQPPAKTREASKSRLSQHQKARQRKRRISTALWALIGLALVGVILYFTVGSYLREQATIDSFTTGSCRYDERSDPGPPGQHIANPTFAVEPPSGGVHTFEAAGAGDYSQAASLPGDGQIVHAAEHGYINIWYRPDIPQADIDALKKFHEEHRIDTLLIPRSTLSTPVAVTAWKKRLLCDNVEIPAIDRFTAAYVNKGPERVPH